MKRKTLKEIDRYSWAISISLLILIIMLSQTPGIFGWAESFEVKLYDYIGAWSFVYTPLVLFTLFSLQLSILFVFIFSRIRFLEIAISAAIYGAFLFYLGDPSKYLMHSAVAVLLGVVLHTIILSLFSRLSSILPSFVESQNWPEVSLQAKINEPGYWVVILHVFFTVFMVTLPVVMIQTWSSAAMSMKTFIFLGSASILFGFHLLKKELLLGYLIFAIPYVCMLYLLFSNIDLLKFIYQNDSKLLIQNIGNFAIFLIITTICIANWKRLRFSPF